MGLREKKGGIFYPPLQKKEEDLGFLVWLSKGFIGLLFENMEVY